MNKLAELTAPLVAVPELPALARTRSGIEFDPREDRWAYRDSAYNTSLDFTSLNGVTSAFVVSAKLTLLWYAENMSQPHLVNMFMRLAHFLRSIDAGRASPLTEITSTDLLNYKASLSDATSWYLGSLSGLLQKWDDLGYLGVSEDAVRLLKQLRIQGNRKGEAVLTHDPINGPFSDIELESLQAAMDRAYEQEKLGSESYLLTYLYMLLGQRSVQYAALKVRDVGVARSKNGTPVYTLRVPRAKQRNQLSRADFKDRVLIPKIGELLVQHANQVCAVFQYRLPDPSDAPLFPAKRNRTGEPKGFEFHRTSQALATSLALALDKLNVMSERTGESLHITATRFRRTLLTRAATEGHRELILAELADHTDTQNVGVYIEARPEIVERIDRAIAMHLAPLAQAFAGVLIRSESEATRADDPSSRICAPRFGAGMKPIASCGRRGGCDFPAPIACYTCANFEPWLDGPHEAVLEFLIGERDRLTSRGDTRIAAINDRTILAVAEVVRQCEAQRGGGNENG